MRDRLRLDLREGQRDHDAGPDARLGLDADRATVIRDDAMRDGEAESGSADPRARRVEGHEGPLALPLVERAIAILRETSGPEHPHLAVFEGNAGNILLGLGRLPQAEERFRRALPVMEAAFGPEHVYVSYGLVGLGRTLLAQGRREEALPLLRRAVELQRQDGVSDSDRAEARFALAQTLLPDDPPRAVELATEAKTLLQGAGPGHARDLADVDAWLAANGRR